MAWAARRAAAGEPEEELGRGRGETTGRSGWASVERWMGKSWAYAPTLADTGERKRAYGRGAGRLGQKPKEGEVKEIPFSFSNRLQM